MSNYKQKSINLVESISFRNAIIEEVQIRFTPDLNIVCTPSLLQQFIGNLVKTASSTLIYGPGDLSAFTLKTVATWAEQAKFTVHYYSSKVTQRAQMQQEGFFYQPPFFCQPFLPPPFAPQPFFFQPSFFHHHLLLPIDARPWNESKNYSVWNTDSCLIVYDGFTALEKLSQTSIHSHLLNSLEHLKSLGISPWILVPKANLWKNLRLDQWDNIIRVDFPTTGALHPRRFLVTIEQALHYNSLPSAHFIVDNRENFTYKVQLFGGKYQQFEMCVRKLTSEGRTGPEILKQFPPVVSVGEPTSIPSLAMLNRLKRLWGIRSNKRHKHRKKAK